MQLYKNLGGNSNILSYDIGDNFIEVQFKNGNKYKYSYRSAGIDKVEKMKVLAVSGQGLNSYIMREAKYDYER